MRIFEHFNKNGKCPICETNDDNPCVLAAIDGTKEGNNCQAIAVHVGCIDLRFAKQSDLKKNMLYQIMDSNENEKQLQTKSR